MRRGNRAADLAFAEMAATFRDVFVSFADGRIFIDAYGRWVGRNTITLARFSDIAVYASRWTAYSGVISPGISRILWYVAARNHNAVRGGAYWTYARQQHRAMEGGHGRHLVTLRCGRVAPCVYIMLLFFGCRCFLGICCCWRNAMFFDGR